MYAKTTIAGYLGKDPEMKYLQSGDPVTTFSVATSRRWKGKDGEQQEETTWWRVTVWGKMAETVNQYLAKGRPVLVEGTVSASAWVGKQDGEAHAQLELRADRVVFLGKGEGNAAGAKPATASDDLPF